MPAETASPPASTAEATETTEQSTGEAPEDVSAGAATHASNLTIRTDYPEFSPNELGRIPVVMFHKFVKAFEPKTEKNYTATFDMYETLLDTLYQGGFRLISMDDFLSGRISVPAGLKPMVFTFDDGTASQFSLTEENGALRVSSDCAVDVLRRFNETHPDFGMHGSFFLNMDMGTNTFPGAGTVPERIMMLLNMGFEIGSHTWGHVDFTADGTRQDIEQALGRNQKALSETIPGLEFRTLALAYGSRPKDKTLRPLLAEGAWEGTGYRNDGIFAVGAAPSVTVFDKRFDPLFIERVRATGKVPAEADLDWWLAEAGTRTFYVSDGNPDTLVIPTGSEKNLDETKTAGLTVIAYDRKPE